MLYKYIQVCSASVLSGYEIKGFVTGKCLLLQKVETAQIMNLTSLAIFKLISADDIHQRLQKKDQASVQLADAQIMFQVSS